MKTMRQWDAERELGRTLHSFFAAFLAQLTYGHMYEAEFHHRDMMRCSLAHVAAACGLGPSYEERLHAEQMAEAADLALEACDEPKGM